MQDFIDKHIKSFKKFAVGIGTIGMAYLLVYIIIADMPLEVKVCCLVIVFGVFGVNFVVAGRKNGE